MLTDNAVNNFIASANVMFLLIGAVMILAMHAGFAFLETGSVRKKKSGKRSQ